jgi:sigma-54 dependent transcriptional regulator, acetoin dehydrogenase operon transcriptional activator AcoR
VETESDIYAGDPVDRDRANAVVLYVAFRGNEPMAAPSRHVVTDIDLVQFGRGEAGATRDRKDGLRRLVIRLPDPLLSTQHGQLVHARGAWVLDDPSSKNGAVVRGVRTRSSTVALGDIFSLGHTVFFLAREPRSSIRALDTTAAELPAPVPELATFDATLATAVDRMAHVAMTDLPVLLLGETGTGKEVTARALHELSRRRGPFVAVNCGAIAATLVESELFGHRRGAFSGATTDKPGYIRTADQGTLFLDEIGELPLPAQTALLRVLQEREVVPVGEALPIPVDLRVCAATHRDLAALVEAGKFREDLYARLLGVTITLPPLRARRSDLGILIPALLRRLPRPERIKLTPAAATRLFEYAWPRNVRELERTLAVMTALAGNQPIGIEHIPDELRAPAAEAPPAIAVEAPAALSPEDLELKQRLEALLREHDHNLTEVARLLGKDRTQIYRWVRRFGIVRDGGS